MHLLLFSVLKLDALTRVVINVLGSLPQPRKLSFALLLGTLIYLAEVLYIQYIVKLLLI